jgi:hypothetical protein
MVDIKPLHVNNLAGVNASIILEQMRKEDLLI